LIFIVRIRPYHAVVRRLRAPYYGQTDMSEAIGLAVPEEPVDEVLVSTSIRLTKTVMDRVRAHADLTGVPATALMRQWITDRLDAPQGKAVVTVSDLEQFIAAHAHTHTRAG